MSPLPSLPATDADGSAQQNELLLGTRTLIIFKGVLALFAVSGLMNAAHGFWVYGFQWPNLGGIVLALLTGISYQRIRQGQLRQGVQILVWGFTTITLLLCFVVAGVRTPALYAIPSLCIAAAWLVGARTAVGVFVATTLVLVGIVAAEQWGYMPPAVPRTSLSMVLVIVPSILLALLLSTAAIASLKSQLDRVTELTQAQQRQLQALRLSEERFSALFRANPLPSSTNDEDGRFIEVNDAWIAVYGMAREAVIGHTSFDLGIWTDDAARRNLYQALAEGHTVDGIAVEFITAGGVRKPFLMHIAPVAFGGQKRYVTSQIDQTDRLAAEAAQRAVHESLEARVAERTEELSRTVAQLTSAQAELVQAEKLASLGAMVAGISHELNTPIGNTLTVSSTLQGRVKDFQKLVDSGQLRKSDLSAFLTLLDDMADVIVRSTSRAATLVTSFRQVAQDRTSEQRRSFDLQLLCQDLVTAFQASAPARPVAIQLEIPALLVCDSYPGPLGQVVSHLLKNAMTHAFDSDQSGHITLAAHSDGPWVVVQVQDNGRGMSERTLKHVFDPFFTTQFGQGGSGLGLSVSHRIATTVLGGSLSASNHPDGGSCFTLRFLREPAPDTA